MIPASNFLSISSLDFFLYIGLSQYGHRLTSLALDMSGMFIFPSSPPMHLFL
jgi:hypothetical protein